MPNGVQVGELMGKEPREGMKRICRLGHLRWILLDPVRISLRGFPVIVFKLNGCEIRKPILTFKLRRAKVWWRKHPVAQFLSRLTLNRQSEIRHIK